MQFKRLSRTQLYADPFDPRLDYCSTILQPSAFSIRSWLSCKGKLKIQLKRFATVNHYSDIPLREKPESAHTTEGKDGKLCLMSKQTMRSLDSVPAASYVEGKFQSRTRFFVANLKIASTLGRALSVDQGDK